eukprot:5949592-Amphidinium_carterae.1
MSTSLIFIDLKAAYDRVAWSLLFGDPTMESWFHASESNTTSERVALFQHIKNQPSTLLGLQLPPQLYSILQQWVTSCWYTVDRTPTSSGQCQFAFRASRGIRQGDSLSTVLFSLYLHTTLQQLNHHLLNTTSTVSLPTPVNQ